MIVKNFSRININIVLLLWTLIIFLLTLTPLPANPYTGTAHLDKMVHFLLFGIFAYIFIKSRAEEFEKRKLLIISFCVSAFFAGMIELLQNFSPGRSCDFWDFFAGAIGSVCFLAFAVYKNK